MSTPTNLERIAVIGLGYVGLPLAVELSRFYPVVGYDVNVKKINALIQGRDLNGEVSSEVLAESFSSKLSVSNDLFDLSGCNFFIIAVPTPVDASFNPDLRFVNEATELVARFLRKGSCVVYESTVCPGTTEAFALLLQRISGLHSGIDFGFGYSPERVSPGDKAMQLPDIVKIVSADTPATLERIVRVYEKIVRAGLHIAPSIKVAEAAKLLENTQRDVNIALMNEAGQIFHKLGICTSDVLAAARTKPNFSSYSPGLVGGHCIGVDSHYLAASGMQHGYNPGLILSARRINDSLSRFIGKLILSRLPHRYAMPRIGILGLTFKENVSDLRNSKIFDLISFLESSGASILAHDPLASEKEIYEFYSVRASHLASMTMLDALVLAIPHRLYLCSEFDIAPMLKPGAIVYDIKSAWGRDRIPAGIEYWSL